MKASDSEDRFDHVVMAIAKVVANNSWPVAERMFKLASWILVVSIFQSFAIKSNNYITITIASILYIIWLAAAFATLYQLGEWFAASLAKKVVTITNKVNNYKLAYLLACALLFIPLFEVYISLIEVMLSIMELYT